MWSYCLIDPFDLLNLVKISFEIKFNLSSYCLTDPFYLLLYLELLSFAPSLKVSSEAKSKPGCKLWSLR